MKLIKCFEEFKEPVPSVHDSDAFKNLVQKYDLIDVTTPTQLKNNAASVRLKEKIPMIARGFFSKNKDATYRVYTIHQSGKIRSEAWNDQMKRGARWFKDGKVWRSTGGGHHTVVAEVPEIKDEKSIRVAVERLEQTIRRRLKYLQDIKDWKDILEKDPNRYKDVPFKVLRAIDTNKASNIKQDLIDHWTAEIKKEKVPYMTKCPDFILQKIDYKLWNQRVWFRKCVKNISLIKDIPEYYNTPDLVNAILVANSKKLAKANDATGIFV